MLEQCCERDTDHDGNCDIHSEKGVLRNKAMEPSIDFKPSDVDLSNWLCSTFGKSEIEYAAVHLIEYLRDNGDKWVFKFSGLFCHYYNHQLNTDEMLFGLFGPWFDDGPLCFQEDGFWIGNWGNGLQVTEAFLKRIAKHVRRRDENRNVV
jgi:hypothetical protein